MLRRAYRLLLADDPRPLAERLTREARRLLVAAAVVVLLALAVVIAAIVVAVELAT